MFPNTDSKQNEGEQDEHPGEHHRMSAGAVGAAAREYWELKLKRENVAFSWAPWCRERGALMGQLNVEAAEHPGP
jgi:hypothetical protein